MEAERAEELWREGEMMEHRVELSSVHARLLLAADRRSEAQAVLREAHSLLLEQADQLTSDESERRMYLEAIPAHRAVIQLSAQLA